MRILTDGQLKGSFKGWKGSSEFKFMNGEVWRQAYYSYRYHYAYMPRARVIEDSGRHWLEVDGVGERLEVRRIR